MKFRHLLYLLFCCGCLVLGACQKPDEPAASSEPMPLPNPRPHPDNPEPVGVTSIMLDQTNLILQLGSGVTLVATLSPENAVDKTVTWESSNPSVATVDEGGRVTTVGVGEAVISARAGKVHATCKLTVNPVPVSMVEIDRRDLMLTVGESVTLGVRISPQNATDKTVTWTSLDASVAAVEQDGKVTAVKPGSTVILAWAGKMSASCPVTVHAKEQ